jgi:hypothetical protein
MNNNDLRVIVFNEIKDYINTNIIKNRTYCIKHLSDDFENNKGFYMDIIFNDLNIKDNGIREELYKNTWNKVSEIWCKMKAAMFQEFYKCHDDMIKRERKQVEKTLYIMLAIYIVRDLDKMICAIISDDHREEQPFTMVSNKKRK